MITRKDIDEFALKVERMCDFLLGQIDLRDGSEDVVAIEKLKDEAANLQFDRGGTFDNIIIAGLADHIGRT